jgi:hypothetical protein
MPYPSGNEQKSLKDTSSWKSALKRAKGKPEGFTVTGETRKPGVVKYGFRTQFAAGQNNSNLAS